jgi:hypothetical protein
MTALTYSPTHLIPLIHRLFTPLKITIFPNLVIHFPERHDDCDMDNRSSLLFASSLLIPSPLPPQNRLTRLIHSPSGPAPYKFPTLFWRIHSRHPSPICVYNLYFDLPLSASPPTHLTLSPT